MKYFFCILYLISFAAKTQNLVPNPSFEEYIYIINHTSYSAINNNLDSIITNWNTPTNGSTDYHTELSKGSNSIPIQNTFDCNNYQKARTGLAFVGLGGGRFQSNQSYNYIGNEYVQVKLFKSLEINKKYRCSFFANVSSCANMYVKALGMYISVDSIRQYYYIDDSLYRYNNCNFTNKYQPQIINNNGFLKDTVNWVEISGYYRAKGKERWITIGNWSGDSGTAIQYKDSLRPFNIFFTPSNYYYNNIDDVSVEEVLGIVGKDSACVGERINYYPTLTGPYAWSDTRNASHVISTDSVFSIIATESKWYFLFANNGIDSIYLRVDSPPTINIGKDTFMCKDKSIFISAESNASKILWSDGSKGFTKLVNTAGSYVAIATLNNCMNYDTIKVDEYDLPNKLYTHYYTICEANNQYVSVNLDVNEKYLWLSDLDTNNFKLFTQAACYGLVITNRHNCQITDSICVEDICQPILFCPNAFVPNGVNKTFKLKGKYIGEIEWYIYDRWGNLIFTSTSIDDEWAGNKDTQSGVYFYIVKYKGIGSNAEYKSTKGTITLIE